MHRDGFGIPPQAASKARSHARLSPREREQRHVQALFVATDCLLFFAALQLAMLSVTPYVTPGDMLPLLRDRLVCTALLAAISLGIGSNSAGRIVDRFDSVYYALVSLLATAAILMVLTSLIEQPLRAISQREVAVAVAIAVPLLALWRWRVADFAARRFASLHRFYVVVGEGREARRIARLIRQNPAAGEGVCQRSIASLQRIAQSNGRARRDVPEHAEAIVAPGHDEPADVTEILRLCEETCARTLLYPAQRDAVVLRQFRLRSVCGVPLIDLSIQAATPYLRFKRMTDIGVCALALVLAAPVMAAVAIAIRRGSPGPVFFRQERLGRHGRPFNMLKFRSMVSTPTSDGPVRARKRDPRVTPVGRFLRKYKLDELPQLINVLKGDMSLVGPRPLWATFFDDDPDARLWTRRLQVRPGLTSLAHTLSTSHFTPADVVRYDLIYLNSLSLFTDLKVLFETARIVFGGKGGQ